MNFEAISFQIIHHSEAKVSVLTLLAYGTRETRESAEEALRLNNLGPGSGTVVLGDGWAELIGVGGDPGLEVEQSIGAMLIAFRALKERPARAVLHVVQPLGEPHSLVPPGMLEAKTEPVLVSPVPHQPGLRLSLRKPTDLRRRLGVSVSVTLPLVSPEPCIIPSSDTWRPSGGPAPQPYQGQPMQGWERVLELAKDVHDAHGREPRPALHLADMITALHDELAEPGASPPPASELGPNESPIDDRPTDAGWGAAKTLWNLLDDIDTANDRLKPGGNLEGLARFRDYVMQAIEKRHRVMTSDGYTLSRPADALVMPGGPGQREADAAELGWYRDIWSRAKVRPKVGSNTTGARWAVVPADRLIHIAHKMRWQIDIRSSCGQDIGIPLYQHAIGVFISAVTAELQRFGITLAVSITRKSLIAYAMDKPTDEQIAGLEAAAAEFHRHCELLADDAPAAAAVQVGGRVTVTALTSWPE